jgi:hypothetical protein
MEIIIEKGEILEKLLKSHKRFRLQLSTFPKTYPYISNILSSISLPVEFNVQRDETEQNFKENFSMFVSATRSFLLSPRSQPNPFRIFNRHSENTTLSNCNIIANIMLRFGGMADERDKENVWHWIPPIEYFLGVVAKSSAGIDTRKGNPVYALQANIYTL